MNNYKVKWSQNTKDKKVDKWKYQCLELEDLYRAHVKEMEVIDVDLEKDM